MWYGGTLTMAASSSPAPPNSTELTRYDARFRCRRTAAFGSPVVPLVKRSTAVASGSHPQPSVSGTVSSATAARNESRSMTSMPSIPVSRAATPAPATTTAGVVRSTIARSRSSARR